MNRFKTSYRWFPFVCGLFVWSLELQLEATTFESVARALNERNAVVASNVAADREVYGSDLAVVEPFRFFHPGGNDGGQIPLGTPHQAWGEYPRDGYYDDLFIDPETGEEGLDETNIVRLIQDMSDKLDVLKLSYVNIGDSQNFKALARKPVPFDAASMPSLGQITADNYLRKFDELQGRICRLRFVESRHMLAGPDSAEQNLQVRWLTNELGGGAFNVPPEYCDWLSESYAAYKGALAYGDRLAPLLGNRILGPRRGPFFVSNTALFLAEWRVVPFFGEIVAEWRYAYQTTVLRTRIWTAHPGFRGTQWFFIDPQFGDHENTRPTLGDWNLSSGRLGFQFFDKQAVTGGEGYYSSRVLDHTTADLGRTRCRKDEVNRRLDITPYAYFEPKFKHDLEECRGCVECAVCSEAELETENGSVQIRIGLGGATVEGDAGFLEVYSEEPSDELSSPAALKAYVDERFELVVNQGVIQQIRGPDNLVDVEIDSDFRYHLRFYREFEGRENAADPYVPIGEPHASITIENPTKMSPLKELQVSKQGHEPIRFVYQGGRSAGWDRATGFANATRIESLSEDVSGDIRTETRTFRDASGEIIEKTIRKYKNFDWGEELIEIAEDPDGLNVVTRFEFYENRASDGSNYGHLRKREDSNGHWEWFEAYDSSGTLLRSVEQFQNNPFEISQEWPDPMNRSVERVVEGHLEKTTVFLKGKVISREWRKWIQLGEQCQIVATRPEVDDWSDPSNLVTRWLDYLVTDAASGAQAGKLARVIEPDGTMRHIRYYEESIENPFVGEAERSPSLRVERTVTDEGAPDDAFQRVFEGERTIVVRDENGNLLSTEVYDIRTETLISTEVTLERDRLGRPLQTKKHDGGIEYRSYDCCGLESLVDAGGVATEYRRDKILELDLEGEDGVPELYFGTSVTRAGVTTHTLHNGRGLPWKTLVQGRDGSLITRDEILYDMLGRRVTEIDALGRRTTTEYDNADGFEVVTTTRPDGGQQIERLFQDGTLYEIFGSAVVGRRTLTGIGFEEDFGLWMRMETETLLQTDGSPTDETTATYYGVAGRGLRRVYADGAVEQWSYNDKGQLVSHSDPDGVTQLMSYDSEGTQTVVAIDINQNGQIDFGGADRITRRLSFVENGNIHNTLEVWETEGEATSTLVEEEISSPDGRSRNTISYGRATITTTETDPSTATRTVTVVDPDLQKTVTVFQDGRMISVRRLDRNEELLWEEERRYDEFGRLAVSIDSRTGQRDFLYYDDGRLKSELGPDPDPEQSGVGFDRQETRYEYINLPGEGEQRVTHHHDGSRTDRYFDQAGRLLRQHGDHEFPVAYEHDAAGRQTALFTWKELNGTMGSGPGVKTSWDYNNRGLRERKTFADGSGTSFEYTPAGRLQRRLSANGVLTTYEFDEAGEIRRVRYSDGTPSIHYRRDRQGRLAGVDDAAGSRTFRYARGEVVSETFGAGLFEGINIQRERGPSNRQESLALFGGDELLQRVGYGYDAAARLRDLSVMGRIVRYHYEPRSGSIGAIEYLTGQRSTLLIQRSSDRLKRIHEVVARPEGGEDLSRTYWYDDLNRRLGMRTESGEQWKYRYGAAGQLIEASKRTVDGIPIPGYGFGFQYDGIGNRTQATREARADSYEANALNQLESVDFAPYVHIQGEVNSQASVSINGREPVRMGKYFYEELPVTDYRTPVNIEASLDGPNGPIAAEDSGYVDRAVGHQAYEYDAEGNLILDGVWRYRWNGENRLVEMETVEGLPGEISRRLVFEYDHRGRRIRKRVFSAAGGGEPSLDIRFVYDGWNLIAELDSEGSLIRSYVWGIDISGTTDGAGGVGGLLQMIDHRSEERAFNYVSDGNGNVIGLVDSEMGSWSARYEYGPFGELLQASGPMGGSNSFQFSTKYSDRETGKLYYGLRYYNPTTGTWISRDPIGERGGQDLYAFVGNDPVGHIDYLGQTRIDSILGAFFSVVDRGERLWVMREDDSYTQIVRDWQVVQQHIERLRRAVASDPLDWKDDHMTTSGWRPSKGFAPDPRHGWNQLEASPPGTDPETAASQFIIWIVTGIATDVLHTSAIGSFRIVATADEIDNCKATLNIWMFNEMSRRSFGHFADLLVFRWSSMRSQFMWWNWKEEFSFDNKGNVIFPAETKSPWR